MPRRAEYQTAIDRAKQNHNSGYTMRQVQSNASVHTDATTLTIVVPGNTNQSFLNGIREDMQAATGNTVRDSTRSISANTQVFVLTSSW